MLTKYNVKYISPKEYAGLRLEDINYAQTVSVDGFSQCA